MMLAVPRTMRTAEILAVPRRRTMCIFAFRAVFRGAWIQRCIHLRPVGLIYGCLADWLTVCWLTGFAQLLIQENATVVTIQTSGVVGRICPRAICNLVWSDLVLAAHSTPCEAFKLRILYFDFSPLRTRHTFSY